MVGAVHAIVGPMFSGKTSELMRRVRRFQIAGKNVILINAAIDTRYSDEDVVSSHDLKTMPAIRAKTLQDVMTLAEITDAHVIGVDEGHFFPDLANVCQRWSDAGKVVVVAALDVDFERHPFASVHALVYDSIEKLTAICIPCGGEATFTRRLTSNTDVELVGGAETYQSVCRKCYVELCAPDKLAERCKTGSN